jgi:two-component system CheB/CheR fusion protein
MGAGDTRLNAILQTAVEGIVTINSRGCIESANPSACRMFGYTTEELLGRNVGVLMPAPEARRHDGYISRYLRTGRARIIGIGREVVGRRKDGTLFPLDLAVSEVQVGGEPMFTGFLRDISERKRAETRQHLQLTITKALANAGSAEEAVSLVLQTICVQFSWERGELWHYDRDAGVLRFERSWQKRRTSFRALEAITRHLTTTPSQGLAGDVLFSRRAIWVPNIANDPRFTRARAALGEGLRSAVAFPVLARDEVLSVMLFLGREVRRSDEELLLVLGSVGSQLGQFIERKRAEETARREHAFSSAILNTAGALVVVLDRKGRIVRFNPACEQVTGYRLEEVRGRQVVELFVPEEEREAVSRVFGDLVAGSFPNHHQNQWLTRRGDRLWIAWSNSALVDASGEVDYVIATGIDVTHQKQLEAEILRVSDLERRRIGHDLHDGLCQQLAGIEFMSQALQQRLESSSPPNAVVAGQISELVREAITQTRGLAHGLSPVMREPAGLMSALQLLAQNTSRLFRVVCLFRCPQPVLLTNDLVAAHAYRIAQEAVSNALRHGRAKRVLICLEAYQPHAVLSVRDNGSGYLRAPGQSSGMGLEIMRYRAAMIGGKLEVLAKPGRGVTVVCTFPYHPPSVGRSRRTS